MTAFDPSNLSKHTAYTFIFAFIGVCLLSSIIQTVRRGKNTTPLKGPPSKSLLFGLGASIVEARTKSSDFYAEWAREYGPAFRIPYALGSSRVVIVDPKAVAAYLSQDTYTYVRSPVGMRAAERLLGQSLITHEGEIHKSQRKALAPAFNNAAIRKLTPSFFGSAYKVKAAWDVLIDAGQSGGASIDVQDWMKHVSIDTIGIAGFSHDFNTLNGEHPDIITAFEAFSDFKTSFSAIAVFLISLVFPIVDYIPTAEKTLERNLNDSMEATAMQMLADLKKSGDQKPEDKSIMGLILNDKNLSVTSDSSIKEVINHVKLMLVAGYETTSISLSWALIELAQTPKTQEKLREELSQFSGSDPTWDQLTTSLPYLDAVVHEILRMHTPVPEHERMAIEDNILPLSTPIITSDGKLVDSLSIGKGTIVFVPIMTINRFEAFWGPDAKKFKPERWLTEGGLDGAKDIHGYRHLLTFSDGPRTCLGKAFAIAEFKAVLCTLIRNFSFSLLDGAEIEVSRGLGPRPKVAGSDGLKLPLRVRRVEI